MRKLFLLTVVLALMCIGGGAWAVDLPTSLLHAVGGDYVTVAPSYTLSGGIYTYSYNLTNTTANDHIINLTLVLPTAVPVTSLSGIFAPAGWTGLPKVSGNKINWLALDDPSAISPTASGTFGFSCAFGPSTETAASSRGQFGYNGTTFGPVPEPSCLAGLFAGLSGLLCLGFRRRTR